MKKIQTIILALAAVFAASCQKTEPYNGEFDQVMIYVGSAYNNLSANIRHDLTHELSVGDIPDYRDKKAIIAFTHNTMSDGANYTTKMPPCLIRLYKKQGEAVLDTIKVFPTNYVDTDVDHFKDVLNSIRTNYKSKHYGMVYSSHGSGWVPCQYYSGASPAPAPKSLGAEFDTSVRYSYEMDIMELAKALPMHLDYLVFDACLMGGIEVAYELKDKCDYIVGSPTEILSYGLHYETMAGYLLRDKPDLESVCKDYIKNCSQGSIGLYDCSQLKNLAEVCKGLNSKYRNEIARVSKYDVQEFYTGNHPWYFDLEDIYTNAGMESADRAALSSALEKAVPYCDATPHFLSIVIDLNRYCGMSMYLPSAGNSTLNAYYKGYAWNRDCGLVE